MTVQSVGSVTAGIKAVSNQAVPNAATDSFVKVYDNNRLNNNGQTVRNQSRVNKNNDSLKTGSAQSKQPAEKTVNDSNVTDKPVRNEQINSETEFYSVDEELSADAETLEDALEKLAALINQITDLLKQFLNVDEDGLSQAAGEIGLEPMDLISGDGIKDLFLNLNGASPEDLLADEELLRKLQELQQAVANLTENILSEDALNNLAGFAGEEDINSLLQNPMFKEVFNEYLTDMGEVEENPENDLKIEINDLRDKSESISAVETNSDELPENSRIKPVSEKEDSSQKQSSSDKPDFVTPNAFSLKMAKAFENLDEAVPAKLNTFRDLYDIAGQTISQIKLTLTSDASSMEIQLHPEHLGKVDLQISSKNGVMTAELTAHTESAKRALEAGLEDLKVSLEQTGLKVENVEVTLAEFGFRQRDDKEQGEGRGNSHQNRRRGINVFTEDSDSLRADFETVSDIMKELNGNSVDYTA